MQVKSIIHEIERLPLQKKFFVMEQTLQSIKNNELKKNHASLATDEIFDENESEKKLMLSSYLVSEKSLAKDWLSDEDSRWDNVL